MHDTKMQEELHCEYRKHRGSRRRVLHSTHPAALTLTGASADAIANSVASRAVFAAAARSSRVAMSLSKTVCWVLVRRARFRASSTSEERESSTRVNQAFRSSRHFFEVSREALSIFVRSMVKSLIMTEYVFEDRVLERGSNPKRRAKDQRTPKSNQANAMSHFK